MLNFATIWNTVRTAITGHPVLAATGVVAIVGGAILRVTGWDLKLLDGFGRMQSAEGAWAQRTAHSLEEKRLRKAADRFNRKSERLMQREAKRNEKAARKAAEIEAKAKAAAAAAVKVQAA